MECKLSLIEVWITSVSISTRGGLSTFFELSENCENFQVLQRIKKTRARHNGASGTMRLIALIVFQTFFKKSDFLEK